MCELPSMYKELRRKAQCGHVCCECRGRIDKGETYWNLSGLWDGRFKTYKVCPQCKDLMDYFVRFDPSPIGELLTDIEENSYSHDELRYAYHQNLVKRAGADKVPDWLDKQVVRFLNHHVSPELDPPRAHEVIMAIVKWLVASTQQPNWPNNRQPCLDAVRSLRSELQTGKPHCACHNEPVRPDGRCAHMPPKHPILR